MPHYNGYPLDRFGRRVMRDPKDAFADAIASGRLSNDPKATNYAGGFMYIGVGARDRGDAFKNIESRRYLKE